MVKDVINENEGMTLSKINVKCNLIDITVKVEDDVKVDDVKKMADKILTVFTEEELKYYDIELMVDSTAEESEVYPIIGTRHKTNIDGNAEAKFVWQLGEGMKKKIIIIVLSLVLLAGIGAGIFVYINSTQETEFTPTEEQWIDKNKSYALDFYMPSEIAGLTYMGQGVFFDFLADMEKRTGLDFNEFAYQVMTPLEDKDYAIELVSEVADNQILMFTDNYVIVTPNKKFYTSPDEIKNLKLGVLASNQEMVTKALTGATVEYITYETEDELNAALIANDGTIDGAVVVKSLYLDELLINNLHIAYQIPELKMNYVLTLNGDKTLNSIVKKSYNKWASNLELSYDQNLLNTS